MKERRRSGGATDRELAVVVAIVVTDGDFGAGAILVPETRRLFVAGGARAICYHHDGERWWRPPPSLGLRRQGRPDERLTPAVHS